MTDERISLLSGSAEGGDAHALAARLDSTELVIRCTADQVAVALSIVNLAARLLPNVRFEAPTSAIALTPFGSGTAAQVARDIVTAVRPSKPRRVSRSVIVDVGVGASGADLYALADAWSLELSPFPIAGWLEDSDRGPANVAASALAVGEVLRRILPELPGVRLSAPYQWNLVDYRRTLAPSTIRRAAVDAVLFGVGSVGSSLIYALLIGEGRGRITVVDPDTLHPRNRLRYPLWIHGPPAAKAVWAASFSRDGLQILPVVARADDWIPGANGVSLAVAAVDNADARRDLVDLMARTTLNAGVDGLQLHVSRHGLGDGYACVYCQYVDVSPAADQTGVYVALTGLTPVRVAQLLGGMPVTLDDVSEMRRAGRLERVDEDLVGRRIVDLSRDHLYAAAPTSLGPSALAVSAPYVSAMAGSLLAAEVLKIAAGSPHVLDRRVDVDLTGYPTGFVHRPHAEPTGRCLCHNPVRQRLYRNRWE